MQYYYLNKNLREKKNHKTDNKPHQNKKPPYPTFFFGKWNYNWQKKLIPGLIQSVLVASV